MFTYWRANVTCYKNLRVTWFGNDKNIHKCLRSNIRCDILRFLSTELKVYVDVLENFAVFFHKCINVNDSFWMETCFARPNTIIANKETGWKQFLQSQIKTSAKVLAKLASCFRIIFSPRCSEFAYVCLSFELTFESKLVFVNKLGCKQS